MALPRHYPQDDDGSIVELSPREAELILEEITRPSLGMSAREFITRYRSGELTDLEDNSDTMRAIMLLDLIPA